MGTNGSLETYFDDMGVIYAGCTRKVAIENIAQNKTSIVLKKMNSQGIGVIPRHALNYEDFLEFLDQEPDCKISFNYLKRLFVPISNSLIVRLAKNDLNPFTT